MKKKLIFNFYVFPDWLNGEVGKINEIHLRFDNYNNFAKEYGVRTNNKRGFWNKETVLDTMFIIKDKYGFMPTSSHIRNNKLYKEDKIFVGLTSAMKTVYDSTIDAYLTFF